MLINQVGKLRPQTEITKVHRGLVGSELALGELDVEQPVVERILRFWAFMVDEELVKRTFPQDSVFYPELVAQELDFLHAGKLQLFKIFTKFFVRIKPEDDTMSRKQSCKGILVYCSRKNISYQWSGDSS